MEECVVKEATLDECPFCGSEDGRPKLAIWCAQEVPHKPCAAVHCCTCGVRTNVIVQPDDTNSQDFIWRAVSLWNNRYINTCDFIETGMEIEGEDMTFSWICDNCFYETSTNHSDSWIACPHCGYTIDEWIEFNPDDYDWDTEPEEPEPEPPTEPEPEPEPPTGEIDPDDTSDEIEVPA